MSPGVSIACISKAVGAVGVGVGLLRAVVFGKTGDRCWMMVSFRHMRFCTYWQSAFKSPMIKIRASRHLWRSTGKSLARAFNSATAFAGFR